MAKIIIKDNYTCQIVEETNSELLKKLDDSLSFKVQGAEHMASYKMHKWDGKKRLLTSNLHFQFGLLDRVKEFYKKNKSDFEIVDNRHQKIITDPIDILSTLKSLNKYPYDYQLDAVSKAYDKDCGIVRMATGSGKSLTIAMLVAKFNKRTIVYVIGKDLLYQLHDLFVSLFDQPIGIIGDGKCEIHDINIATVWSVGQALGVKSEKVEDEGDENKIEPEKYGKIRDLLKETKLHIFDECQLCACGTIQEISKHFRPENVYGFSASPWRDDKADKLIECILGKRIVDISASYLIDRGYLVKPTIKFISVPPYPTQLERQYQTVYRKYITENEVRNALIIRGAERLVEQNFQTLVLYNSIEHGKKLYESIKTKVPAAFLSGKDKQDVRQLAKENLESGKIKCIVASKIFDIGVDMPSLSGLIIGSAGKSSVRALQRVGRVIRKYDGKKTAAVIDFADQAVFLSKHAENRREIYSSEERFDVRWPNTTQ